MCAPVYSSPAAPREASPVTSHDNTAVFFLNPLSSRLVPYSTTTRAHFCRVSGALNRGAKTAPRLVFSHCSTASVSLVPVVLHAVRSRNGRCLCCASSITTLCTVSTIKQSINSGSRRRCNAEESREERIRLRLANGHNTELTNGIGTDRWRVGLPIQCTLVAVERDGNI
jgi:hypothetical protein